MPPHTQADQPDNRAGCRAHRPRRRLPRGRGFTRELESGTCRRRAPSAILESDQWVTTSSALGGPRGVVELRVVERARAHPITPAALRRLAVELVDPGAGPVARTRARALLARVELPADLAGASLDAQLLAALSRGLLRLEPPSRGRAGSAPGADADAARDEPAAPAVAATRTWIAIQLVEERDPERPVAYARYRIVLPDGAVREGRLDASGLARFDDLDPGICHVTFPDLDGSATTLTVPGSTAKRAAAADGATPAARPPPPPVCRAVAVDLLEARGIPSYRKPGGGVLQVVPLPVRKSTAEFGMPFTMKGSSELVDAGNEMGRLLSGWRKKGRKDFFDELRGAKAAKPPEAEARKISLRVAGARYTGGKARIYAKLRCSPSCTREHPLELKAPDGEASMHRQREEIALGFSEADLGERSVPSVYELSGRGCEGDAVALTVEVFPPTQVILTGSVEVEVQRELMGRIKGWLESLCGVRFEAEAAVEGAVESFEGWRQEEREWSAFWCRQFGLRFTVKGRIEASVSLLHLAWRVPEEVREYLGDVVVLAGLEPAVSLDVAQESRRVPGAGRRSPAEGAFEPVTGGGLKGSLGMTVGAKATIGSTRVLGASVTLAAKSELALSGRVEREKGRVKIDAAGELSETRGSLQVLGKALLWKTEPSWEWTLFPAATWRPDEPIFLSAPSGAP